jgi:hypothetical protein
MRVRSVRLGMKEVRVEMISSKAEMDSEYFPQ